VSWYNTEVELRGAVVQLGEHHTGSVDVRGSSPLSSTIFTFPRPWLRALVFLPQVVQVIDSSSIPGSLRSFTVERVLLVCVLVLALAHLPGGLAVAQPKPTQPPSMSPQVLVMVFSGVGPLDQVAINYNKLASKAEAETDVSALAKDPSWMVRNVRFTTGKPSTPGAQETTSSLFQAAPLPNARLGSLPIEQFIIALRRFKIIQINYLVASGFDFRGPQDFENRYVKIQLKRSGSNSYQYTVNVKDAGFDQLSLPIPKPEAPAPQPETSRGGGRIVLIIGIALAIGVCAYVVAVLASRARSNTR
jgi:hypothetical protein